MSDLNLLENIRARQAAELALRLAERRYGLGLEATAYSRALIESRGTGVDYDAEGNAVEYWRAGDPVGSAPVRPN